MRILSLSVYPGQPVAGKQGCLSKNALKILA
jgi:hypothetical protein